MNTNTINPDVYHNIIAVTSYEEFMLKLAVFNITGYEYLTESEFDYYCGDDWKWHEFACVIASNCVLPF